ncbi:CPBP family intramembrane glutamic endopeptidase [Pseudoxanthomonas suwonensis]|uniref:CAAX prenyl protease 2/Lysostaphin resistance protein A-like domain-containing protein n=1 Tax=Pseudoxanthomonas suwonensis TaxID=314722 RepID=A0A0E3Z3I9_9GAMM|nr:CPBP family intramembrane glutamic endopeptidase [Pseudoxanthomonas suwonensis]AKC87947.1 hypothetical protein WQ53_15390 [Pseudoxanthomonas suwonensis]
MPCVHPIQRESVIAIAARRSPGRALGLLLVVVVASTLWFASPAFPLAWLRQWQLASGGWVSVTLMASVLLGGLQLLVIFGPGRQRPGDVGWRRRALGPALLATVGLWAAMQLASVAAAWSSGTTLQPAAAWSTGLGVALGPLLAQLLGTALMEETVFRGYLWPQLARRLADGGAGRHAPWIGLVASQLLFGLLHVPLQLQAGAGSEAIVGMVLMLFVVGVVFALLYAATRNLFVAVGAHALGNAPTPLFEPQGPAPTMVLLAGVTALGIGAWWWQRRQEGRHAAGR